MRSQRKKGEVHRRKEAVPWARKKRATKKNTTSTKRTPPKRGFHCGRNSELYLTRKGTHTTRRETDLTVDPFTGRKKIQDRQNVRERKRGNIPRSISKAPLEENERKKKYLSLKSAGGRLSQPKRGPLRREGEKIHGGQQEMHHLREKVI